MSLDSVLAKIKENDFEEWLYATYAAMKDCEAAIDKKRKELEDANKGESVRRWLLDAGRRQREAAEVLQGLSQLIRHVRELSRQDSVLP